MPELLPVTTAVGISLDEMQDSRICCYCCFVFFFCAMLKIAISSLPEVRQNGKWIRSRTGRMSVYGITVVVYRECFCSKQRVIDS